MRAELHSAALSHHFTAAARMSATALAPRTAPTANVSPALRQAAELGQQAARATSPVQQAALLRQIDGLTGSRQLTDILSKNGGANDNAIGEILAQLAEKAAAKKGKQPTYTGDYLFGFGGPSGNDIKQDALGDCYFVATLGAVAKQDPQAIRNAIRYDTATKSFNVTLYDSNGNARVINVTQADIRDNIARSGGSYLDNGNSNAAIWPAVMETAFAKMNDTNHANGLDQGYNAIANGGWPKDAMETVTGSEGTELAYDNDWWETSSNARNDLGSDLQKALAEGRPVTAWSVAEKGKTQDGLADNHVYTVERAYKDKNGEWHVVLRNPWGTNNGVGEGKDAASATIDVPLKTLVETGGLQSFRVGDK